MRYLSVSLVTLAVTGAAGAQTPPAAGPAPLILVKAGRLIDGRADAPQSGVGILVEGDRVKAVGPLAQIQGQAKAARVIDLSQMTVLPGFIDAHTHLLLQGDPTAASYNEQLLYESTAYRAILAARNAKIALDHGFTTIRDLETEGAMYADVDVKRAVDRGEIPGPRIFASTRAMAPTLRSRCAGRSTNTSFFPCSSATSYFSEILSSCWRSRNTSRSNTPSA